MDKIILKKSVKCISKSQQKDSGKLRQFTFKQNTASLSQKRVNQ